MNEQEAIKTIKEAMYFIDGLGARAISSKMAEAIRTLEASPSKAPISTEPLCSALLWYCAECYRAWDYGDLPAQPLGGSEQLAHTQTDAQHAKNLTSNALAGTDYADRLRWLLSQAERVVTVDAEDRRAVDRACALLKEIDNGFDKIRT